MEGGRVVYKELCQLSHSSTATQATRRNAREGTRANKTKTIHRRQFTEDTFSANWNRMAVKISIILVVLAVLAPCYLSAPRPTQDVAGSCSDGKSGSPLNCPSVYSPASPLKDNQDLWGTMCGSRVLQQLAKGVCYDLSEISAKNQCCTNFPTATDTEHQTDSELVSKLATGVEVGRGVVQLGQQVCTAEEVKFVRGCPNQFEECRNILVRTEELQLNITKAVLSYNCSCGGQTNLPCHYNPTEVPAPPEDISTDLRGFAKWATKFANSVLQVLFTERIKADTQGCEEAQVVDTTGACREDLLPPASIFG